MSWALTAEDLTDLVKNRDSGSEKDLNGTHGGVEGLAKKLNSDAKSGLSAEEESTNFNARREQYGTNVIPERPPTSYFTFLLAALSDHTLIILMVAAVVSIGLATGFPAPGESRAIAWIEGFAILVAVAVVSNVTATNDTLKDRKFRQLTAISEDRKVRCVRGGEPTIVPINDILVGDVILIETGDFIPADLILIEGSSLRSDESSMTGESDAVKKNAANPWLLSGCTITEGTGKGIAVATGVRSQWGQIKAAGQDREETKTPLQEHLEQLAENIGKAGVAVATLTLIGLFIRWAITTFKTQGIKTWQSYFLSQWVRFLITSITIIVVAVPEGLPLAVTLSLAYSMLKMMKDQNLVRHLAACETMGGATNICSDKTGTLTQNRMTVVKLWAGKVVDEQPKDKSVLNETTLHLLNEGACINSTAFIQKRNSEKPEFIGLKTECALLMMANNLGTDYEKVRNELKVVKAWPFSSRLKRMSTIIQKEEGLRIYTKGASEVILEICNQYINESGNVNNLAPELKSQLFKQIDDWASQGLRTLTLAYKELPNGTPIPEDGECPFEENLILVGIVGIQDPLRPEVSASIATCRKAGITVRMVTGDNILTAKQIAKECGILTEGGEALEGPVFRKLSLEQMDKIIPKLQVIARCSPEDKLTLVKRLIHHGEVVAVTGDGTNDVPALIAADVGFAMGISGTEVAKDSCDIILLDDNFSSIERAVMWGRGVYDSIRKFLQFQLTVNIVAVTVAFVGALSGGESPLQPVQLLWVNLIMDTMAALALSTERPSKDLFDRPPHGRFSPLITWRMWRLILGNALLQIGILFWLYYGGTNVGFFEYNEPHSVSDFSSSPNPQQAYDEAHREFEKKRSTVIFNTFVFQQIFNEFNARKLENEKNMFSKMKTSYIFIGVVVITIIVQFILVQFGGEFSKTSPLNGQTWAFCIGVGLFSLPFGLLLRCIPVPAQVPVTKNPNMSEDELEMVEAGSPNPSEEAELIKESETPRSRKSSKVPAIIEPNVIDPVVDNYLPGSPSRGQANWGIARKILTQVQVTRAFRKPFPESISGTHV